MGWVLPVAWVSIWGNMVCPEEKLAEGVRLLASTSESSLLLIIDWSLTKRESRTVVGVLVGRKGCGWALVGAAGAGS